jgi:dienelactone hydrolase
MNHQFNYLIKDNYNQMDYDKPRHIYILYLIVLEFFTLAPVFGQTIFNDSLMNGNNYEKASFRLWYNSDIKKIRGLILLVPGSNYDGRDMVYDTAWQNLALRHNFALLGCYYKDKFHDHMEIENYVDVKNGSGRALLEIIRLFSSRSKHPELEYVPVALWGMSAGGEFNYEFVCWKPEMVIAFIVNKGGIYYSSLAPAAAWEVPGVFITGEKDSPYRNNIITGIFSINRRFGAKWIFAVDPRVGHEFKNSEVFARFFFDNIIPLRLSCDTVNSANKLQKMTSEGYIGIVATRQILPDSCNKEFEITSWFANRQIADGWLDFIK